ncbi:hypothetical protein IGI04_018108, partial [Brassica rapa subsp. trilocularis]
VLDCHMEFLGTFGCIWSLKDVKQVIIGRAEHGSEVPQRRHESDLPKATHRGRSHLTPLSERPPKATPRGCSRLYGETTRSEARSDLSERPTEVAPEGRSDLSERHAEEELCFINNNGSWYKKEPNFQYNNYQQKSYLNNQQSGYPPRNNQQGSYQPQQNPSSGSSAPQESSTDTLLKQILESQTRSEKHVGYELKNLHTKIDGSYNELNNKFSHLTSTVLECHMEFLGTFGCIWSLKDVKQVIIGRAEHGSEVPQRRHESDLPKATHRGRSHLTPLSERPPKATPRGRSRLYGETTRSEARSDLSERPTEVAPEGRSDLSERHAEVAPRLLLGRFLFYLRAFWSFHYAPTRQIIFGSIEKYTKTLLRSSSLGFLISNHNASFELATQLLILRHFSPESSILDHPRSNPYAHEFSFPLVKKCFDIPQNWFDNHLYYNICLRSLENS